MVPFFLNKVAKILLSLSVTYSEHQEFVDRVRVQLQRGLTCSYAGCIELLTSHFESQHNHAHSGRSTHLKIASDYTSHRLEGSATYNQHVILSWSNPPALIVGSMPRISTLASMDAMATPLPFPPLARLPTIPVTLIVVCVNPARPPIRLLAVIVRFVFVSTFASICFCSGHGRLSIAAVLTRPSVSVSFLPLVVTATNSVFWSCVGPVSTSPLGFSARNAAFCFGC